MLKLTTIKPNETRTVTVLGITESSVALSGLGGAVQVVAVTEFNEKFPTAVVGSVIEVSEDGELVSLKAAAEPTKQENARRPANRDHTLDRDFIAI